MPSPTPTRPCASEALPLCLHRPSTHCAFSRAPAAFPLQPAEDSSTRLDRLASGIKGKVQMLEHLVELYGGYMVVLKVS